MKTLKQFLICLFSFVLVFAPLEAKDRTYKGEIKVAPLKFSQVGRYVRVQMKINLDSVIVTDGKWVDIVPMVSSDSRTIILPKVSIKSPQNYKAYNRGFLLLSDAEKDEYTNPYRIIVTKKPTTDGFEYSYSIPYQSWMEQARLEVQKDACGCGKQNPEPVQVLSSTLQKEKVVYLDNSVAEEPYDLALPLIVPSREVLKHRVSVSKVSLDFKVKDSQILPDFNNNSQELKLIGSMIKGIKSGKGVTIDEIEITGFASPEGAYTLNKTLSENRAKSLKEYISQQYDIPSELFTVKFGGENWDGLLQAVKSMKIDHKDEIIDIISNTPIYGGREKKLMDLADGEPYKYLRSEIFPSLRIALCNVSYSVAPYSLEDTKEMISTRPQNLSLQEMFNLADSYEVESPEFAEVFEIAAKMFPDDPTANINAALTALRKGDIQTAEKYLLNVKTKSRIPEYDNARGVLEMLKGNFDESESYLKAAQQAGLPEASKNLKQLESHRTTK